ncbi:hypothetical protein TWF694_000118 [Orbilia ellipsospora]
MKKYSCAVRYKMVNQIMNHHYPGHDQIGPHFKQELYANYQRNWYHAIDVLKDYRSAPPDNTWNRDFDPAKITPELLDIVSSSRFIIAGFGHNTANTIKKLDSRVKNNIQHIFITHTMIASAFPGNKGKWEPSRPSHLIRPEYQDSEWEDDDYGESRVSEFESLLSTHLPNLKKVAISIRHHWNDLDALRTMLRWFDTGKIETLELVYPGRPRASNSDPEVRFKYLNHTYKKQPTIEDAYEILYDFAYQGFGKRDPAKKWRVEELSSSEVEARGRFSMKWEYPTGFTGELNIVEGTVFRLVRGEILPTLDGPEDAKLDLEPLRERTEDEMAFFEAAEMMHGLEI